MRRIYEPGAYGALADATNFWRTTVGTPPPCPPLEGEARCEIAIVGAGVTGLNAALELAGAEGADIRVLEAETPGFGASGRSGGFVCLGGAKASNARLQARFGAEEAQTYRDAERAAVSHVEALLDTHSIEADRHSRGETLLAHGPAHWAALEAEAPALAAYYGVTPELIPREALADHGLSGPGFHGAMTLPIGFALNPLKYTRGLLDAALAAGVEVHGQSPVLKIEDAGGQHRLITPEGSVVARTLILAMNGYASEDVPGWMAGRYLPVQSSILVTRPLTGTELQAQGWTSPQMSYDTRRLLHYFRLMPDNRMLFGMRGGITARPSELERRRGQIRRDFERMFPAWRGVETPHYWSGFVCFTADQTPFVGALPGLERAYAGFAYHGNGMAMGSYAGALLADLVTGRQSARPYPAFYRRPPRRFPLGRHRRALLRPALGLYRLQDLEVMA